MGVTRDNLRVQDGGVGDIKCGSVEFFENNLRHSFTVGWSVPGGFCDEDWVVGWINAHNVLQCMTDEWSYRIEIFDYVLVSEIRLGVKGKHVLRPSFKGFPTSIPCLQIEGPS